MSLNLQPTLRGERLRLRPILSDDFLGLYAAAADPLIWEQHPQPTRHQAEVFQKYFDGAVDSGGALVAEDRDSGEVIGCSRYYDYRPAERRVTIGYTFLVRRCWGGAFNREMKALMLEHAFTAVDEVQFHVGEANLRSRRAIERIGARLIEHRMLDGNPHRIYAIRPEEFKP